MGTDDAAAFQANCGGVVGATADNGRFRSLVSNDMDAIFTRQQSIRAARRELATLRVQLHRTLDWVIQRTGKDLVPGLQDNSIADQHGISDALIDFLGFPNGRIGSSG